MKKVLIRCEEELEAMRICLEQQNRSVGNTEWRGSDIILQISAKKVKRITKIRSQDKLETVEQYLEGYYEG